MLAEADSPPEKQSASRINGKAQTQPDGLHAMQIRYGLCFVAVLRQNYVSEFFPFRPRD
jgi:hypothetical protein